MAPKNQLRQLLCKAHFLAVNFDTALASHVDGRHPYFFRRQARPTATTQSTE
jgi:hypothetical protein